MTAKHSRRTPSHGAAPAPASEAKAAPERSKLSPGLYLVATPIGNLGDISQRALDTLAAADLVACEDTRVSGPLLRRYGIATPLFAYHEHNAAKVRPELLRRLAAGQTVALIADAGTPLISDPGYKLVRAALAQGSHVSAVPGPSAVMAALCLAGLPTDRFLFAGFPPAKSAARRRALAELAAVRATLVFLEGPHRLAESLADMAEALGGGREAAVARELTKLYEEVRRDNLAALAAAYGAAPPPKGEIVVVVGPPAEAPAGEAAIDEALAEALKLMSVREAVAAVAAATGAPRRAVYARALALADAGAGR